MVSKTPKSPKKKTKPEDHLPSVVLPLSEKGEKIAMVTVEDTPGKVVMSWSNESLKTLLMYFV